MVTIKLTNGKELNPVGISSFCGEHIVYTYEHHYNSRSSANRFIDSAFVRYCKGGKIAIIQRMDCSGLSRVPIEKIYREVKPNSSQ